ncbi:YkvA family protein [Phenylobacterium sp.]|jgi:uncharacterized membrane protein YkvA (DUF1232 family)|uniref:YkvA family protein n=1 Tax=Phenylobacterium sp. TaxID=1871053 RepID=UPI0037CB0A93
MSGGKKASPDVTFDPQSVISPDKALVPSVIAVNEERVASGFWPKIRKVAAKIPFARDALSVWHCARDEETPLAAKGMMLAALAYFVMPVDVVPDFIAGLGFTDDAAVFAALVAVLGRNLKPKHREAAQEDLDRLGAD